MQLLVVHHDAEVGEQLVQMVEDYTPHRCDHVASDAAALRWADSHARCGLLLAQLGGPGTDALTLGGSFAEIFDGLQTVFLPAYASSARRLEVANSKVFPEPIDGELLLNAIERIAEAPAGSADYFHALDVLQMCCLSSRSGAVQMVRGEETGIVFLKDGRIVDADTARLRGADALSEIGDWHEVEFAYDGTIRAGQTISTAWDEALIESVVRHRDGDTERSETAPLQAAEPPVARAPEMKPAVSQRRSFFRGLRGVE
ncbi:MAG: DUF4388 domain-containing protein [Verrucomicrobiota bacterium]|nr:DUF4388 domain-containing protein [Verrucomicrobiota bacterium]